MRHLRLSSLVFGASLLAACNWSADSDSDDAAAAALRNCPPSKPDCIPELDPCRNAKATITAGASPIHQGQTTSVTWSTTLPEGCGGTITLNSHPVAQSGTQYVVPLSNTPYRIFLGTKQLASVNVNVILPSTVHIGANTADMRRVFLQAIGMQYERIVLANNVDLDLTGYEGLYV